ncbi:MAG: ATP-binding protein, partial [Nitrospira sp.]|nr:ATP-binding protein [Nitrospira sp.]
RFLTCSAAAGPAFEGGRIRCGMRAQPGAIDQFFYDPEKTSLAYHVLGKDKPKGISGSGLISLLSLLVDSGMLLSSGRFHKGSHSPLASRLRDGKNGTELLVVPDQGGEIVLTQQDVRELQLAKAAIAAGAERLMEHVGLSPNQLDWIYLCGAFGTSLDPRTALRTGLLPGIDPERIVCVGNAAGAGAKMVLCQRDLRETATSMARSAEYLELSSAPRFNDLFMEHLLF